MINGTHFYGLQQVSRTITHRRSLLHKPDDLHVFGLPSRLPSPHSPPPAAVSLNSCLLGKALLVDSEIIRIDCEFTEQIENNPRSLQVLAVYILDKIASPSHGLQHARAIEGHRLTLSTHM